MSAAPMQGWAVLTHSDGGKALLLGLSEADGISFLELMNLLEAMNELVIFAREAGVDEDARLSQACALAEQKAARLRQNRQRREVRRSSECECCGRRSKAGLLCWECSGAAPERIRTAFAMAAGLDGMRAATQLVRAYARGGATWKEEAA